MSYLGDPHEFLYEETDVPEGMPLGTWSRARRTAPSGLWARFCAWCHR